MLYMKVLIQSSTTYYLKLILRETTSMPFYSVAVGRKVGVYGTWGECKTQTIKYPNAKFKKFDRKEDAEAFVKQHSKGDGVKESAVAVRGERSKIGSRFLTNSNTSPQIVPRVKSIEGKRYMCSSSEVEPSAKKPKLHVHVNTVNNLMENDEGYVEVYTDGACSKNGQRGASAGIGVWFNDDHPLNVSAPVLGPPTNNNAEIQAARVAVTTAAGAGVTKLCICTDSMFLIDCITKWIANWKKNNWRLASGGPVKNKEELTKLDAALQSVDVRWKHVLGHTGVRGNEMADRLARQGADRTTKPL